MITDKFIITISDVRGTRHISVHKLIKNVLIYFTIFVVVLIVGGAIYIEILSNQTRELTKKKEDLIISKNELFLQNEKMQKKIDEQNQEFQIIEDKIAEFEEQIGLTPSADVPLSERVDDVKVTKMQLNAIFSQIPNGNVIKYKRISANFGWRQHPILQRQDFHPGVDLSADTGTPVYAPADGVVQLARYNAGNGYGYLVVLEHNFGFKTRFAHLSRKDVVKEGEFVKKGQLIGYSGNTGLTTGPHLHYEVRFVQKPLNPVNFMKWNEREFENIFEKETKVPWQSLIKAITDQLPKQQ